MTIDSDSMRVMRIAEGGELVLDRRPRPSLGPEEVRVRVHTAGVNRGDILQRKGVYPAPPGAVPDVPGLEYAGEVVECGPRVFGVAPGARVMGLVGGGAYGEELAVHHRTLMPIPRGMDFATAAAIPEAFVTAYDALVLQGGLVSGQRVLIHAVGSGVGTAAVQIAKAWGATVIGTSRTPAKLARAAELGLDRAIVPDDGAFAAAVLEDGPVALVLDLVGGGYTAESVKCMAIQGRLMLVGLVGGLETDMPLTIVLKKRLRIQGTVLRARPIEEKISVARAVAAQVLPLFASGRLRPVVAGVHPMAEADAAHRHMGSNRLNGKLVLTWA